jgi:hypothetical protein
LTASGVALDEILAVLVVFFPLGEESRSHIASPTSLNAIVSVLSHGEIMSPLSHWLVNLSLYLMLATDNGVRSRAWFLRPQIE